MSTHPPHTGRRHDYGTAPGSQRARAVLRFVHGIYKRRSRPVLRREITQYFHGTSVGVICATVQDLVRRGLLVDVGRGYDITEPGYRCMIGDAWWIGDESVPMKREDS